MQDVSVNIYPPFKKYLVGNKIIIRPIEIKLFESISVLVQIVNDSTNDTVDTKIYLISGDEYSAWASDDQYIVNLIKQKLSEENSQ
jgi:hypothetical protein